LLLGLAATHANRCAAIIATQQRVHCAKIDDIETTGLIDSFELRAA
jgi:hypothetical protein